MKFTINVDCTPEEARTFLGLPDVSKINQAIVDGVEQRTNENLEAFTDPQKFYDKMMSGSGSSMDAMQQMFATMMANNTTSGTPKKSGK